MRQVDSLILCVLLGMLCLHAAEARLTGDAISTKDGPLLIQPINHASLALGWKQHIFYVDPVGSPQRYANLPKPTIILITDIHGDHLDAATLTALATPQTRLVAPPAVVEKLPADLRARTTSLENGKSETVSGVGLRATPAYNLTPERTSYHPKGRGNGYVLTLGDKRVYLSGDTEDIPEMRALKDIDVAFLCMNLPYTMTVEQAAQAVKAFRPKVVYPYHCRGSDLKQFQALLQDEPGIEVRFGDWYQR